MVSRHCGPACSDIYKGKIPCIRTSQACVTTKNFEKGNLVVINFSDGISFDKDGFPFSWTLLSYWNMKQLPALLHLARSLVTTKKGQFQRWFSQELMASWH
jgi:hypothetical protein